RGVVASAGRFVRVRALRGATGHQLPATSQGDRMKAKIVLLPGDGIGGEVVAEARTVLEAVGRRFGHEFVFDEQLVGGVAIDRTGSPLPEKTLEACRAADAVL